MNAALKKEPVLDPCKVGAIFVPPANDMEGAKFMQVKAGMTVAEMLGDGAAYSLRVTVGGVELPRELWPKVKPKAGKTVTVEFFPQGGGGDNSTRKWVLTIVAIVATVFSYGAAAGQAWAMIGGLSATTVIFGGAMVAGLAMAMIPPPSAGMLLDQKAPESQVNSITGTQNQLTPYGSIPIVIGDWTMYPVHAAMPYTEIVGEDQYMRLMLDIGKGDVDVSEIEIKGTPVADYDGVEWEVTKTPTLYTHDIYQDSVGTQLNGVGTSVLRTTQVNTTEISVDLVAPRGLFGMRDTGEVVWGRARFHLLYRAVGQTAWQTIDQATGLEFSGGLINTGYDSFQVTVGTKTTLRCGVRWTVPAGQYEVKVTRDVTTYDFGVDQVKVDDFTWTVLRSISPKDPSYTDTTKLVMRIKATTDMRGVVHKVSVRVAQKVRRWDYATQTFLAPVASTNPAWIYLWMLTECPAATRHAPLPQVDLLGLATWAEDCDNEGYRYSGVVSGARTFASVAKDVLACGRATAGMPNGKYGVVRDIPQTVTMQTYTPANGTSLTYEHSFASPPHGLRISFTNPQANQQIDERVVYWDGYNESNATHIEKMDMHNVTDPSTVWKLGRYHLASMWLRPNKYHLEVDVEHLINERGDLVEIAAPLIGWGAAYGRIKAIAGNTLTLTEAFTVEAGKSYSVKVRKDTAYSDSRAITVAPGDIQNGVASVVTMSSPLSGMKQGDLVVVGEVGNLAKPVIIIAIEPGSNMLSRTAKLTVVDAAPGVWSAADGVPPVFVSSITGTSWCAPPLPPLVHIYASDSAPDNAGIIHANVKVGDDNRQGGFYRPPPHFGGDRGGGGGCVVVESFLPDMRRAGEVVVDDTLPMADPVSLAERVGQVVYSEEKVQPCVEITTETGVVLRCSKTAPIPTETDGLVLAPHLAGKKVAVKDGDGCRWERVHRMRSLGLCKVQHISVNDGCFWAGKEQGRYILHHNKIQGDLSFKFSNNGSYTVTL